MTFSQKEKLKIKKKIEKRQKKIKTESSKFQNISLQNKSGHKENAKNLLTIRHKKLLTILKVTTILMMKKIMLLIQKHKKVYVNVCCYNSFRFFQQPKLVLAEFCFAKLCSLLMKHMNKHPTLISFLNSISVFWFLPILNYLQQFLLASSPY